MAAKRGFAAMSPEMRQKLSSRGGTVSQLSRMGNRFTPETARIAGQKGGKAVSQDREHMREMSRLGVAARAAKKASNE